MLWGTVRVLWGTVRVPRFQRVQCFFRPTRKAGSLSYIMPRETAPATVRVEATVRVGGWCSLKKSCQVANNT